MSKSLHAAGSPGHGQNLHLKHHRGVRRYRTFSGRRTRGETNMHQHVDTSQTGPAVSNLHTCSKRPRTNRTDPEPTERLVSLQQRACRGGNKPQHAHRKETLKLTRRPFKIRAVKQGRRIKTKGRGVAVRGRPALIHLCRWRRTPAPTGP